MNKPQLLQEISNRTNFTRKDCKVVFDTFLEILSEQIAKRENFSVRGLGQVKYIKIPERKAYKPNQDGSGTYIDVPESDKIIFTLSENLRKGNLLVEMNLEENDDDYDELGIDEEIE